MGHNHDACRQGYEEAVRLEHGQDDLILQEHGLLFDCMLVDLLHDCPQPEYAVLLFFLGSQHQQLISSLDTSEFLRCLGQPCLVWMSLDGHAMVCFADLCTT